LHFSNCESFKKKLFKTYGFSPLEKTSSSSPISSTKTSTQAKLISSDSTNNNLNQIEANNQNETLLSLDKDPDIILDFSAVNYIDTNGVKTLHHIIEDYKKVDVFVYVCNFQGK
jgi:anti-anti-sigma regulatory factor